VYSLCVGAPLASRPTGGPLFFALLEDFTVGEERAPAAAVARGGTVPVYMAYYVARAHFLRGCRLAQVRTSTTSAKHTTKAEPPKAARASQGW
jgi:hypothetical protein